MAGNTSEARRGQRLILVVEDDQSISTVIRDFVETLGYRTATASDGREAVDASRRLRPDLIIMDLMMPRLTGGEAAGELRNDLTTARIPILAISAVANVADIAELLPLDGILEKPFELDDLQREIERLLPAVAPAPENNAGAHPPS